MAESLQSARDGLASLAAQLAQAGVVHRAPPPEPGTCCGRGCNGCVWEGWYAAVDYWREDALALLASTQTQTRPNT